MITPLAHRQVFQTANVEAVRMSLEMSEQIQREAARRKIAEDRLLEDQSNVPEIGAAESLRAEERDGRKNQERSMADEDGEGVREQAEEGIFFSPMEPEGKQIDILA